MGRPKLTYDFIKYQFNKRGYVLLSVEYKGSHSKLEYLCPKHGQQTITYSNLSQGGGCAACKTEKQRLSFDIVKQAFDDAGYMLLETEYINNSTLMRYLCAIHGEQTIRYNDLQSGHGCSKCGRESTTNKQRLSFDTVRKSFEDIGYTLISTEYVNHNSLLVYLCPLHGQQVIRYNDLQQGIRCPQCNVSKGEQCIQDYLDLHGVTYASQYTFEDLVYHRKLRFDFAIFGDDGKTIVQLIEYQGRQHYEPVDFAGRGKEWADEQLKSNQIKDQIKVDYCKLHNIPLLTIKYSEFSYLEELLDKEVRRNRQVTVQY